MKRILYNNPNLHIIIPASNCGLTIEQIAEKDVPAGLPYLIVNTSEIPTSRTYRNAFECEITLENCDGVGGE